MHPIRQTRTLASPQQVASTENTLNRPRSVSSQTSSSSDDLVNPQPKGRGKKRKSLEDDDKEEKLFFATRRQRRSRKEKAERLALRSVKEPPPKIARNPRELRHLGIEGIVAEEEGRINPLRDPARKFPRLMEKYPRFLNRTDGRTTLREAPQMGLDIDGNNGDEDNVRAGESSAPQDRSNIVGVPVVSAESQVSEWLVDVPMPPLDEEALAQQCEDNKSLTKQRPEDLKDIESVPLGPPTESNIPTGETGKSAIAQQLARSLKDYYHVQDILSTRGTLNEEYILETIMPPAIAAGEEDEREEESLFLPATNSASKDASELRERARKKAARSIYHRLRQLIEDTVAERGNRVGLLAEAESQSETAASRKNAFPKSAEAVARRTHIAEATDIVPSESWDPPTGPRAAPQISWQQQQDSELRARAGDWRSSNSKAMKIVPHLSANRYRGEDGHGGPGFAPVSGHRRSGGDGARSPRSWTPAAAETAPYRTGDTDAGNKPMGRESHVDNWDRKRSDMNKIPTGPSRKGSWVQSQERAANWHTPALRAAAADRPSARHASSSAAAGWTKSTWYKDTKGGSRAGGS